jgi:hypothetical protein
MREAVIIVTGQWVGRPSILRSIPGSEMLILGPPSHISSGHWGMFCALEKTEGESKKLSVSSAKINNMWRYISTPPHGFMMS